VLLERLDVFLQGAEEEPAVGLETGDLRQIVRAVLVELLGVAGAAGVLDLEQLALVVERPAVERAGEIGPVVRLAPAQHRPAVAARVDQAVQLAILGPGNDHRGPADIRGEVVPDLRDLALMRQVHPVALEDMLHLQLEQLLIREDAPLRPMNPVLVILYDGIVQCCADSAQCPGHVRLLHLWPPPLQWRGGCHMLLDI
jgi:hypothetical protein